MNQSIPVVLPVNTEVKERAAGADALALMYNGRAVAVLRAPEFYPHRKVERCSRQFGIYHTGHPYIKVGVFKYLVDLKYVIMVLRLY